MLSSKSILARYAQQTPCGSAGTRHQKNFSRSCQVASKNYSCPAFIHLSIATARLITLAICSTRNNDKAKCSPIDPTLIAHLCIPQRNHESLPPNNQSPLDLDPRPIPNLDLDLDPTLPLRRTNIHKPFSLRPLQTRRQLSLKLQFLQQPRRSSTLLLFIRNLFRRRKWLRSMLRHRRSLYGDSRIDNHCSAELHGLILACCQCADDHECKWRTRACKWDEFFGLCGQWDADYCYNHSGRCSSCGTCKLQT